MELAIKKRSYHVISGRLRIELYGLKNNPDVALQSEKVFSSIKGICYIETNIITGKILLQYDENIITLDELCFLISKFEEILFKQLSGLNEVVEDSDGTEAETFSQVAATADVSTERVYEGGSRQSIVGTILRSIPKNQRARAPADEQVPLPLALSVTGLGVLGLKQLFFGRSILAGHPVPFFIAAALSVSTDTLLLKSVLKNYHETQG